MLKKEPQISQNSLDFPKWNSQIIFWFHAFRPKTLGASAVPIIVSTFFVQSMGYTILWWIPLLAFLSSIMIQIGTNLINDASDFHKGADNEFRLGPLRVTQKGIFTSQQVLRMAYITFAIAVLLGLPLVIRGGLPILAVGIFSLIAGYAYTMGPYPLAYKGLGDVFVLIFFGLISVSCMILLLTGHWLFSSIVLGLQVGSLATVLIAINNLRDVETDLRAHKMTLAVRLGKGGSRLEIAFLLFLPFVLNLFWLKVGYAKWTLLLPYLVLPKAGALIFRIYKHEPSSIYNSLLAQAAFIQFVFSIFLSVGFVLDT